MLHIVRRSRSGSCRVFPHTPCTDLQLVNNSGTTCELLRRYSGTRFSAATDSPSLDCIQGERRTMTFRRSRAGTASSTPMSRRSSTVRAPAPRGITFPERDPADTDVFLSSDRWVRLKHVYRQGAMKLTPAVFLQPHPAPREGGDEHLPWPRCQHLLGRWTRPQGGGDLSRIRWPWPVELQHEQGGREPPHHSARRHARPEEDHLQRHSPR